MRERKGFDADERRRPVDALLVLSANLCDRSAALRAAADEQCARAAALHAHAAALCSDVLELRARAADRRARAADRRARAAASGLTKLGVPVPP